MAGVGFKAHGANFLRVPLLWLAKELVEYFVDSCVRVELRLKQFPHLDAHIRAHIQVDMVTTIWKNYTDWCVVAVRDFLVYFSEKFRGSK